MDRGVTKGILLAAVSLATVAMLASPADAHPRRADTCLAPNGSDDTAALQSALDRCTGGSRRCVVSLCDGVFRISPVRVGGFGGVLRGAGQTRTVIEALPNLDVNANPDAFWKDPPLEGAPWPYLVQFIGGRAEIRDLAIRVPSPQGDDRPTLGWNDGWFWTDALAGALLLTGRDPVDFEVRRVRIVGGADGDDGTALLAGIHFQGLLFNPDDTSGYPVHPVRGRFRVSDSEFVGMLSGTPLWELADAKVTVARNRYHSILGMDVLDTTRSQVAIYGNDWDVEFVGAEVILNIDGEPSRANTFMMVYNRGSITPLVSYASGVYFSDPGTLDGDPGNSMVVLAGNRLEVGMKGKPAESGLEAWGAGRLRVYGNALSGWVGTGIRVEDTTGCRILGNVLRELETDGGPDLVLGPGTSECVAVVDHDDVVQDDGWQNLIYRR